MAGDEDIGDAIVAAAGALRDAVDALTFSSPVAYVYNPLRYAWAPHEAYLRRFGAGQRRIIFMGMNPGPFGMAQTGVPFGEVEAVRDWLGIIGPVGHPPREHPRRPIAGFDCRRSEVSGRRLWGFFRDEYGTAAAFFRERFVVNYCPLVFMDEGGRNLTPDRLPRAEREALLAVCNDHLREVVRLLRPEAAVGVGVFARRRLEEVLDGEVVRIVAIPHPSPASPAANRGWAAPVREILRDEGLL